MKKPGPKTVPQGYVNKTVRIQSLSLGAKRKNGNLKGNVSLLGGYILTKTGRVVKKPGPNTVSKGYIRKKNGNLT